MEHSNAKFFSELEWKLKDAAPQRDINNRAAVISALTAVLEFLYKAKPEWTVEQLHRPLVDLLGGLHDLDKGRQVPLLSPTRFPNRHPDAFLLQMMRGYAIFAIERLVTQGESVTAAKEKVARIWNKYAGEPKSADTIKSWYDRRDKIPEGDPAFKVLVNVRSLSDIEKLDQSSAAVVERALHTAGLNDDFKHLYPDTERGILDFLARVLTEIKPRP